MREPILFSNIFSSTISFNDPSFRVEEEEAIASEVPREVRTDEHIVRGVCVFMMFLTKETKSLQVVITTRIN